MDYNENPQMKIDRLEKEIEEAKRKQRDCQHEWEESKYDPKMETEFRPDYSAGLQGHGSDPYYKTYQAEKTVSRWSRTCNKCGFKEYTYSEKVVEVKKTPDFKN